MSYRELWVFVRHLPQESWTQTVLRDAQFKELINPDERPEQQQFGPWALINYQMAALTDAVKELCYATALAGNLKVGEPPSLTPRPGLERRVRVQSDAAVVYLDKLRARG